MPLLGVDFDQSQFYFWGPFCKGGQVYEAKLFQILFQNMKLKLSLL